MRINTELISIKEYNRRFTPKVLGGWVSIDHNSEIELHCVDCVSHLTINDFAVIYDGDVESYELKCANCGVLVFNLKDKWIPCPQNDGGFDCTPFCPTCEGVQFIRNEE